jgi:hypothetical protein
MYRRTELMALVVFMLATSVATAFAQGLVHAVAGAVTKVDAASKTIAVRTADGTEEVFKYSGRTSVTAAKGVKTAGVASYMSGKEGTHVIRRQRRR